jgi:hypothetical protein
MQANGPVPGVRDAAGNIAEGIVFLSASRTVAAYNSQEFINTDAKGIRIYVTNDGAGGSTATVKVQTRMPGTTNWTDIAGAATAALGAVTGSIITIYPGLTGIADSAGVTINQHLGASFRLVLTIAVATGTSMVSASYLL